MAEPDKHIPPLSPEYTATKQVNLQVEAMFLANKFHAALPPEGFVPSGVFFIYGRLTKPEASGMMMDMNKSIVMLGMVVGSTIGAYLPALWGAGMFSFSSILFSFLGGLAGIWASFKLVN